MSIKRKIQQFLYILVVGSFVSLPLKISYNNIFIIASFCVAVLYTIYYRPKINFKNSVFWFFNGLFFCYCLSAFFSQDSVQAWSRVEVRLMYLLIPYPMLLLFSLKQKSLDVMDYYVYGLAFFTSVLIGKNLVQIITEGNCMNCYFHDFTELYRQHAVYYSLLLLIGVIHLGLKTTKPKYFEFKKQFLVYSVCLLILIIGLFFAASKIMIVLMLGVLIYIFIINTSNLKIKWTFTILLLILLTTIITSSSLKSRFIEGLRIGQTDYSLHNRQFTYDEKEQISDLDLRVILSKIGWYHMVKDKRVWTGYGIGDQQDYFDYYLMRYNLAPDWYQGHNVHNQYLDLWLNLGAFGLLYFLLIFGYLYYLAIKEKHEMWIILLVVFTIAFLFEVYLNRNKGIVTFTIFNMYFYLQSIQNKSNKRVIGQ